MISSRAVIAGILVSLALLTVALYWPGLSGPLLFDDQHVITNNAHVRLDSLAPDALSRAMDSFLAGGRRQLSMLSFALNHYAFDDSVWALKAVNLFLHLAVGALLFMLLSRLLTVIAPRSLGERPGVPVLAIAVVGCWLVHPINLTSVLYVSQRMTILSSLFMLAGMLVYAAGRTDMLRGGRFGVGRGALLLACLLLAFVSKENGVLLIPFVLLLEWAVFGGLVGSGRISRTLFLALCVLAVGALLLASLLVDIDLSRLADSYAGRSFTLTERVLTEARVLIWYISLVLVPVPSRMGLWHDDFVVSTALWQPWTTLPAVLLVAALLAAAVGLRKRAPLVSLGLAWFFVAHSLESTIFPLELVHEHRNYLASAGILLLVVGAFAAATSVRPRLKWVLLVLLGISFAVHLGMRAHHWRSGLSHALHEYGNHPASVRASHRLALELLNVAHAGNEEVRDAAYEVLGEVMEREPRSILPEVTMLIATNVLEQRYSLAVIERVMAKISQYPHDIQNPHALRGLRRCIKDGECRFRDADIRPLFQAAAESGSLWLLTEAALWHLEQTGESDAGLELLRLARDRGRGHPQTYMNLADALSQLGRPAEAAAVLDEMRRADLRDIHLYQVRLGKIEARIEGAGG